MEFYCRIRVRRYALQRCFLKCVLDRHSGRTSRVMVYGAISYPTCYEFRVILIATDTSVKCYILKPFPSFKTCLELSFSRITHANALQRLFVTSFQSYACNFFLACLFTGYVDNIEHDWGLVGRRLALRLASAASKDELWLRIQEIWNSVPRAGIQKLFDSMPRRIAALIAARCGYTKILISDS